MMTDDTFKLVLFGGGRWSRVLVSVLREVLPEDHHIFWISTHGYEVLKEWATEHGDERISVLNDDKGLWARGINACVVATAPVSHAKYAEKAIEHSVPVLVEKPFVLDENDAARLFDLAKKNSCVAGIDFVFMYASYLEEFAGRLKDTECRNIEIVWHDPEEESRHGDKKRPDFYTSIAHDMFPHAWSILQTVLPDRDFNPEKVSYDPSETIVEGKAGNIEANMRFSRRGKERVRKISVNDGALVLDFSQEPGFVLDGENRQDNEWGGPTPLFRSLEAFIQSASGDLDAKEWSSSLENCFASVGLACRVSDMLDAEQTAYLLSLDTDDENCAGRYKDFLIDMYLPMAVKYGSRPVIDTEEDRGAVAVSALKELVERNRR